MSVRQVTFLGTASQVPTRWRNHNALFLQWDEFGVLFDPGEGTQRQMTMAGLSATQITHVCITHFHGDHCLGLAGIIQRLSLDRVDRPVEIIFPATGQVFFERLRHASAFHEVAKLVPRPFKAKKTATEVCRIGGAKLFAAALDHGIECQGYRLQEDDGIRMLPDKLAELGIAGPAVGKLIKVGQLQVGERLVKVEEVSIAKPGQAFAMVMDTRLCSGAEALAHRADLLVCESTYQEDAVREADERFHMTAAGAAHLAKSAGARLLGLTHFSQRYPTLEGFEREASAVFPEVFCAADLALLPVPRRAQPQPPEDLTHESG